MNPNPNHHKPQTRLSSQQPRQGIRLGCLHVPIRPLPQPHSDPRHQVHACLESYERVWRHGLVLAFFQRNLWACRRPLSALDCITALGRYALGPTCTKSGLLPAAGALTLHALAGQIQLMLGKRRIDCLQAISSVKACLQQLIHVLLPNSIMNVRSTRGVPGIR